MLRRSPIERSAPSTASVRFSTGTDSPVSAASSVLSTTLSARRRSAGITFPASSSTMSPGTSSAAGRSLVAPSRTTRAVAAASFLSAAIAFSARYSWMKPIVPFISTITTIAIVSMTSPMNPEITAAATSTMIMKSVNWSASIRHGLRFSPSLIAFGP